MKLRPLDFVHVGAGKNAVEVVRLLAEHEAHNGESLDWITVHNLGGNPACVEVPVVIDLDTDDQFIRIPEERVRKKGAQLGNCHAASLA